MSERSYQPETEFRYEGGTIYNLRERGRYMVNDVYIRIEAPNLTDKQKNQIAEVITNALNEEYPANNHPLKTSS